MSTSVDRILVAVFLTVLSTAAASAAILAIDISTTAAPATPLYGADFNTNTQAIVGDIYGVNYRDYQIALTATSPVSLSDFAITVKGDIQQNTSDDSVLGITMWTGPIVANPSFSNSLVTVWTNALGLPKNGFFDLNLGLGGVSPNPNITTNPSVFHLRVWGSGAASPNGFKVKLADGINLLYDPLGTSLILSNFNTNTLTYSSAGTYTYTGPGGETVPEPGTWVAGVMVLFAGALAVASRRRSRVASEVSA
ncbi:MAG: hypothetical protein ACO3PN_04415 [Chthoniobacterales bacterium]